MNSRDSSGSTFGQGVGHYLGTLLQGAKLRADLMSLEWREEKRRLFQLVLFTILVALLGAMAVASLNLLVLVLFWDDHRLAVTVGFTVLYSTLALAMALIARHRFRSLDLPFQATFEELRKDREHLMSTE